MLHGRDCAHTARHGKQLNGEQWGRPDIDYLFAPIQHRHGTLRLETGMLCVSAVGAAYEAYRIRRHQRSCRVTVKTHSGMGEASAWDRSCQMKPLET